MVARGLRTATACVATLLGLGVLSACHSSAGGGSAKVSVVASTDVWGSIATQVAGALAGHAVRITSIINDPAEDPHAYQASPRDLITFARAGVVVENGGGYDDFVTSMLATAHKNPTVINAVTVSGKKPVGGELNEHVWYDFPTVAAVAAKISAALAAKDPSDAATFRANAKAFTAKLTALEQHEAAVRAAHAGTAVAITEPVPLYMLQACGLVNRTPARFSEAVENGSDVAPRVLQQALALFTGARVSMLVYNEQTTDPATTRVLAAARSAHIPTVPVTETLPKGDSYLAWMTDNLARVQSGL